MATEAPSIEGFWKYSYLKVIVSGNNEIKHVFQMASRHHKVRFALSEYYSCFFCKFAQPFTLHVVRLSRKNYIETLGISENQLGAPRDERL